MKLNLLVAYPYLKPPLIEFIKANEASVCLALDSGAFTAWKAKKSINIDDYCKFIETLPFKPHMYFTLDVIGKPAATMANYQIMLKRGFKPVPIFTRGEDPSVLEDYYKTSDIVGIGGLVKTPRNKGFVKGLMKHIGNRKCHWLGFVEKNFVMHYKPYSCDSSSIMSPSMYGCVYIFDRTSLAWHTLSKLKDPRRNALKHARLISSYGVDPVALTGEPWRGQFVSQVVDLSMRSHCRASIVYERIFKTKYFMAAVSKKDVENLYRAHIAERING